MGTRHSSYKRLEEEHEFVPASSWRKKQQESEIKSKPAPETADTEQGGPKLQQGKGAEAKNDSEKK